MVVQALSPFAVTTRIDRVHCKPWGLHDGEEAAGNGIGIRKNGVWETDMPNAKIFGVRLRTGDAYLMQSGGGGGFGSPLDRDAALVALDVQEGYVSREAAHTSYGVVVSKTGVLDAQATENLRGRMKTGGSYAGDNFEVIAG